MPTSPQTAHASSRYKWYVLAMLTGVSTFAFIDRQLVIILQEAIKADMGLSDAQLGLLTGLAFSIFYVLFAIPVAHLADRNNRRNIMVATLSLWSVITALTGLAANYFQLLLARIGVGIGETGSSPPAYSMIADYFPPAQRARAYAVHGLGVYFGLLFGFLIGGIVEENYGWRMAFYVVGIPGVLFALLLFFTVKEPVRGNLDEEKTNKDVPPILEVVRFVLKKKTFVFIASGAALHTLVGNAYASWMPPFLARVHGMGSAEIGIWLAFAIGICGGVGTYLGGHLADKWSRKDYRWYLWLPAIATSLSFPFALGVLFSGNKTVALLFYLMPNILYAIFLGPCFAVLQEMVGVRMRAVASAILMIVLNLIGLGLGPLLTGLLSDYFQADFANYSIRWALFVIGFLEIPAIYFFWKASTTLKADVGRD